ncbi:TetR/AcrR family transcriptional regulator [Janibacter sp. G1551]|uniref:TetR/AcrR family transcriptional regulator n=1 Tax=Janibacter sp. G1551 TaxID=3420440 RepID=UPI003CFBF914
MAMTDRDAPVPPRGQRLPRAERRAQLLESAQDVFVVKGYHAAAMEDIADRAGVSKPVLYQHFPGKLELYLALLDQQCDLLEQLVREALEGSGDPKERVYATTAAYFEFVARDGAAFRLVFESDLTNEPAVRHRLDAAEAACAEMIAEHISTETVLPIEIAHVLGVALAGMAQVTARSWLAQGTAIPREDAARAAGHLAWRGIGAFPIGATAAGMTATGGGTVGTAN